MKKLIPIILILFLLSGCIKTPEVPSSAAPGSSTEVPDTSAETVTSEAATEEQATAGPTAEEPTTEEAATAEPKTEEPTTAESTTAEPSTAEPAPEEPTTAEPATEGPAAEESSSSGTEENFVSENTAVDEFPEAVLALAEKSAGSDPGYEIGTGVFANAVTEDGISSGEELDIYPFYKDGQLDALIYFDGEYKMLKDQEKLKMIEEMMKKKYSIVSSGGRQAFVSEDEVIAVDQDELAEQLKKNLQILKLQKSKMKENPFGNLKTPVRKPQSRTEVKDPETGKSYSSTRVVVILTESSDETVKRIEEELGITLYRKQNKGKICVFVTAEPKYIDELKALVEKAKAIEGVENATLDAANELQGFRNTTPTAVM